MNNWIKTSEKKPKDQQKVICALLQRYSNSRWKWSLFSSVYSCWDKDNPHWEAEQGHSYFEPDYWMPFPKPPEMTKEQKRQSEECFKKDKEQRLIELEKKREKILKER